MRSEEYFEYYYLILKIFEKENPRDMHELFKSLQKSNFVSSRSGSEANRVELARFTMSTVDNLLSSNLLKGSKDITKSGNLYDFEGLTTEGYSALLNKSNNYNQFLAYIKDNGIPLDATSVSKAVINFLFRKKQQ